MPGAALTMLLVKTGTDPLTATDVVPVYTSNKFSPVILSTTVIKTSFLKYVLKKLNVILFDNSSLIFQ